MRILLVEDNEKLANNLKSILEDEKYLCEVVFDGQCALETLQRYSFDLLILDLGLPDIDGIEVCKEIRKNQNNISILMLTARIDLDAKVEGLDCGADDYLTKPFLVDELLARIRVLLRRGGNIASSKVQLCENLLFDLDSKRLMLDGLEIGLSAIETRLIEYLALNRGKVCEALEIYSSVWGEDSDNLIFSETLKVHISRIRKKIGIDLIHTSKGRGYIIY
jgi:DNA-binding response OmpR family regulator